MQIAITSSTTMKPSTARRNQPQASKMYKEIPNSLNKTVVSFILNSISLCKTVIWCNIKYCCIYGGYTDLLANKTYGPVPFVEPNSGRKGNLFTTAITFYATK